ncbi:Initiation-specific alpha-1-6-mannosyltransferase 2 [Apiospora hydei]|uniref:Initiation-specific alpha-1-6-mannosyltransferase 2 n=1 Tax=Apiospora hydei TaxID=1337664 RepID=A0ABR1XC02_9PEZI
MSPSAATAPSLIPRQIWQVLLPVPDSVHAKGIWEAHDHSWLHMNPDYTYTRISTEGALAFIDEHFPGRSDILETFRDIQNPGMKSDLLRYLVLLADGGIYTDMDTTAVRPINEWVPKQYRDSARILVGIERDIRDEEDQKWFVYPIQFAQWTIGATPHHPIMEDLVDSVLRSIQLDTEKYKTTVDKLDLSNQELVDTTGPTVWTSAVWRHMQEQEPGLTDMRNLSFLQEPTLYGDVLLFPINSFGSGQAHSGSLTSWQPTEDVLVKYHRHGSWRTHE